jgi:hypothetical protein
MKEKIKTAAPVGKNESLPTVTDHNLALEQIILKLIRQNSKTFKYLNI